MEQTFETSLFPLQESTELLGEACRNVLHLYLGCAQVCLSHGHLYLLGRPHRLWPLLQLRMVF